jgi:hypothetical protein
MAWVVRDTIDRGEYLMIQITEGIYLDLTFSLSPDEVMDRLRPLVKGFSITRVIWNKGVLGINDKLLIFGVSNTSQLPNQYVKQQIEDGLNSFWEIANANAIVYVSDNANEPIPADIADKWSGTIQLVAVAVIVVAVVYAFGKFSD